MEIELIPIADLLPYANNARTHSHEQVEQIAASIREFGWTNPVLIDQNNGIIAGHGRALAAEKVGMTEVPCIRLGHLTETQRRAYVIADNQLALNAGWDEQMLGLELSMLREEDFDLGVLGFDDEAIEKALNPPELKQHVLEGGEQGKTPKDALEGYENSTIRQIVLIMGVEEFEETMKFLEIIKKEQSFENNTEAAAHAIREYANNLPT